MPPLGFKGWPRKCYTENYQVETPEKASYLPDKTGSFTQNIKTVTNIWSLAYRNLRNFTNFILSHATLCCDAQLHIDKENLNIIGEPTEKL